MILDAKAVCAVQYTLNCCHYSTRDLNENDRTMLWDGEIFDRYTGLVQDGSAYWEDGI